MQRMERLLMGQRSTVTPIISVKMGGGDYLVNEDEARVVNMIWSWFGNENLAVYSIQRKLFDLKIMPKKGSLIFGLKVF